MALPIKFHRALVSVASQPVDGELQALAPDYADPVEVWGQMTAKTTEAALAATGLDLKQPHKWMCDLDAQELFSQVGNRVQWGDLTLYVAAPPVVHNASLLGDHVSVMLAAEVVR